MMFAIRSKPLLALANFIVYAAFGGVATVVFIGVVLSAPKALLVFAFAGVLFWALTYKLAN